MDRKDATIEMFKSRVKSSEDETKEFEQDVKEKQLGLTKDLHALNKKTENYLKKLRKAEISNTSLKSIILTVFKHLSEKCSEYNKSLDMQLKFNHSEAMKLLDLSENELDMFINTNTDHTKDCALVRLLDMEDIETEEVIKIILDQVNKMVTNELKSSSSIIHHEIDSVISDRHKLDSRGGVKKKYED